MILPKQYEWLLREQGPKMLIEALGLLGTKEMPGDADNPEILAWAEETGLDKVYSADTVPWCGLFMALIAKRAEKQPPVNPLWALNWAKFGVPSTSAGLGDVLVFRRNAGGHVSLYIGEDNDCFHCLGGNQHDQVNITRINKDRCVAVRRPVYNIQPSNVRKILLAASGEVSINEN